MTRPASATRITLPLAGSAAATRRSQPVSSSAAERRARRNHPPVGIEQPFGVRAGPDGELAMRGDLERRDPQPREPALGQAEDVALLAQLEVLLGQLEAVVRLGDRLEAGLGDLVGRVRDEDAERLDRAASDPAAQLVQLGEAEPVRALDRPSSWPPGRPRRPRSTVVPTRTSSSPSRNRLISASRSAAFIRPWTMPDPERIEQRR